MSRCPSCQAEVTPDLRFCLSCGTSLSAGACPSCGAPRVPGARFCGQCGSPLEAITDAATWSPAAGLADELQRPTERRIVSVLFADLVGFTALSADKDPETVREFLTAYFERASEVIGRYGGTVEKFIGDAVMAVWGTPVAHEDDAERAVRAALDLVGVIGGISPAARLRAAVMTGEAAVTPSAQGQGLVAGDLVNTSSRLQSAAAPGSVLVDETTRVAAGRAITFASAGAIAVKGKSERVKAWTALQVVAQRGGGGRRDVLEPPFVGRDEESRLLKESVHATSREGKSRLVTVIGQAGLGKSRLAWELKKYTDGLTETIYWHEGRSPAYGEGAAYWALSEMVRWRCHIDDDDVAGIARAKVAETLKAFVPDTEERAWVEPRLAALLGLAEAPAGEREELFAAWRTFFERVSAAGTVVLIFEDIHWADESLYEFIEHLLEWARGSAILVVALARPDLLERRPAWGSGQRTTTTVHLEPLGEEAMGDLLRGLVPGLPAGTLHQVVERAEGVPLYAVETVRMLIDEGGLVREGERYRLVNEAAAVAVPATLQALVTARLDVLAPAERELVHDASILGRTFTRAALVAVTGRGAADVDAGLQALMGKEIIEVEIGRSSADREHLGFVQGLLREVAYSALPRRHRRARHLAAAHYFESLADEELVGLVASHYLDAYRSAPEGAEGEEAATQAATALRVAAERAVSLHANAAALTFIEEALSVTREPEERARLWVMANEPAWARGQADLAERYLRRAIDWYGANGRASEARRAAAILASGLVHLSRTDDLRALVEPILAEADLESEPAAPRLLNELARAYLWDDRVDEALAAIERGLAIAERMRLDSEIAELFATKSWAVDLRGRHREALLLAEGSLRISERIGAVSGEQRARMNLSNGLNTVDPRGAYEVAGRGVDLARRIGHATWAASLAGNQGYAALQLGEWETPLRNAAELYRPSETTGWGSGGVLGPAAIVEAFRDRPSQELQDEALATYEAFRSSQAHSIALTQRALYAYARGRLDEVVAPALEASTGTTQQPGEAVIGACVAANAATWLRDEDQMARVAERLRSLRWAGDVAAYSLVQLEAAIAALDGRTTVGEAGYREALEGWRRLGLLPNIATAETEMLRLLGDGLDDRFALAEEARSILQQLGAVTLLARLEEVTEPRASDAGREMTEVEVAP